jgi:type 1 glutamine amidotransferase
VLVYSRTQLYRPASIPYGQEMLQEIGAQQGFEVTLTEQQEDINAENLAAHEVVLFLHTTGTVLGATQKEAFEDWMKSAGAFVGIGHAVDAEANWSFYKELTGQYIDNMTPCCPETDVTWRPDALEFPAVRGLPSPWRIGGLWFFMSKAPEWSKKPGFKILGTVTVSRGDQVVVENPVSFVREFDGFRSFYAGFGHQSAEFQDANVRKHITAGILWTARREHLIQ